MKSTVINEFKIFFNEFVAQLRSKQKIFLYLHLFCHHFEYAVLLPRLQSDRLFMIFYAFFSKQIIKT